MSWPLFRATLRANIVLLLIFIGIHLMYITMIISMYDPVSISSINEMLDMLPVEMINAFGFNDLASDLTGFIAGYYYGFLIQMFPMIYIIILANRLVARQVDQGSMACLLMTPTSRLRIAFTQFVYLLASLLALFAVITAAGIATSESMFPGLLDIWAFLLINVVAYLLMASIASISFFFSCLFNETSYSLGFGAGLPLLFFLLHMLGNVGSEFAWIGNFSLFSVFDAMEIARGSDWALPAVPLFGVIIAALGGGGILIFHRKNLPI